MGEVHCVTVVCMCMLTGCLYAMNVTIGSGQSPTISESELDLNLHYVSFLCLLI